MKLKVASLKNPRKRIEDGDWITYTPWTTPDGATPVRFKVSGTSIEAWKIAQEDQSKRFLKQYDGKRVPTDVVYKANSEMIVEHLLHGWEGLDVEYSPEVAEEMLTDRDYEALTDAVLWCANQIDRVSAEFVEDGIKNSAPPSAIN